jgi:hypothetical protein
LLFSGTDKKFNSAFCSVEGDSMDLDAHFQHSTLLLPNQQNISSLLAVCKQIHSQFGIDTVLDTVPSMSALNLYSAGRTCQHRLTADWRQKSSRTCTTQFDVRLSAKIEQNLPSQFKSNSNI